MNKYLFTCEHSSADIPAAYRVLFRGEEKILRTHRGWDEGAKELAEGLAKALRTKVILGKNSRLLVDLNRTSDNRGVFSDWTRPLPEKEKRELIEKYHEAHWNKVRQAIRKLDWVIHVGVHSFTPVLYGSVRKTDIGLLHDPKRKLETELCLGLQKKLRKETDFAVHRNLPYRGTGNGLVTALRKEFPADRYIGLELEINQRCLRGKAARARILSVISAALSQK
ncbi:MAG: N-formylglutamate amidohydrolase [Bacteriovoracia bacterium]